METLPALMEDSPALEPSLKQEDHDAFDNKGRYDVRFYTLEELRNVQVAVARVVFSNDDWEGGEERVREAIHVEGGCTIVGVAPSVWRGVIKNVPGSLSALGFDPEGMNLSLREDHRQDDGVRNHEAERAKAIGRRWVIVVGYRCGRFTPGPILVLQGLRYQGNVGASIRTAVQANMFEEIIIIDPEFQEGAKNNTRILDKDMDYYSLMNAPLISIRKLADVTEFVQLADSSEPRRARHWVATALGSVSVNMFSDDAGDALVAAGTDAYMMMGSETDGLPEKIIGDPRCTCLRIPSMSSSINVGAALAMVIACTLIRKGA